MSTSLRILSLTLLSSSLLLAACGNKTEDVQAKTAIEKKEYIETTPKVITVSQAMENAVNGAHRSEKNKARDQYRNPAATLEFFGVRPESTVVELWPGGGWYSEILAPYLKDKGSFYAAGFGDAKEPAYRPRLNTALKEKFASAPDVYGKPNITGLNPPGQTLLAPSGSADFVLTFRNVHNWLMDGHEKTVYQSAYNALKPGGIFGVVEHRANETANAEEQAKTGYVSEEHVIAVAESVGFKLVGKSEVNANPKDTKDHEKGVWTLPPSLALKDVDKDKYLAIGESDRMTLKFQKPE